MERYVPSGLRDGRCGVCERLEVHGVCWLEGKQIRDGGVYRLVVHVQPILEVGEVDEQYLLCDTGGPLGSFRILLQFISHIKSSLIRDEHILRNDV